MPERGSPSLLPKAAGEVTTTAAPAGSRGGQPVSEEACKPLKKCKRSTECGWTFEKGGILECHPRMKKKLVRQKENVVRKTELQTASRLVNHQLEVKEFHPSPGSVGDSLL